MGIVVREKTKGSGVFWVFATWQGQRRAKRVGDRKAAEAVASQLRGRLALGDQSLLERQPTSSTTGVTFKTVAERWLDWYPALNALRPGTLGNHRKILRAHLLPALGDMPIGTITRRRIQELIAALRAPGASRLTGKALADSTIRTSLPTLRLVLDFAVEERLITANPMIGPRLWRSAPQPETIDPFTGRELRAILEAAEAIDRDFAAMLRLWVQSGMRSGEVRGLQRGDVDLERGIANVQRSRTKRRVGPTKTGRTRLVSCLHPVSDDVAAWEPGATRESRSVLVALKRLTVSPLDPAGPLFFTVRGKAIDERRLYRMWNRALTKAGVRYREPEQLRHTFASTMLSRNAPILYVAVQGGWKNPGVLFKHYAKWLPQAAPRAEIAPATPLQPRTQDPS